MFLLRSQDGSTPLHIATRTSVATITRLIGEASPEEAFQMEDGVGNTPLEIATFNWLRTSALDSFCGTLPTIQLFDKSMLSLYHRMEPQVVTLEEAKALKDTIARLVPSGRLRKGTKLTTDLTAFADKKSAEAKKRAECEAHKKSDSGSGGANYENDTIEHADAIKTMEYIIAAASTRHGPRQLVHLIDVHRSVQGSLDKSVYKESSYGGYDYRNKDEEGGKEEKAKKHSAVSLWHGQLDDYAFELFAEDNF